MVIIALVAIFLIGLVFVKTICKPQKQEAPQIAFETYISNYEEDSEFSLEEEKELLKKISAAEYQSEYISAETYYEIGNLYWSYYGGEDDHFSGKKLSGKWFEKSIDVGLKEGRDIKMAKSFVGIASYLEALTSTVSNGYTDRSYSKFFEKLKSLVLLCDDPLVIISTAELTMYSNVNFHEEFIADGVSEDEISKLLGFVFQNVESVKTSDEDLQSRKEAILKLKTEE